MLARIRAGAAAAAAACCCAWATRRSARASGSASWVDRAVTLAARPSRAAHCVALAGRLAGRCCSASASPCSPMPMSQGTPFANVLLVCDLERGALTMKPVPVTAFTLVTRARPRPGGACRARCARARSGLRAAGLRNRGARRLARRGRRRRRRAPARRRWRATTAATTGSPARRCAADGFDEQVRRAAARHGRAAGRRVGGHQHLGHPADRARLPPARLPTARCPPGCTTPRRTTPHRWRASCRPRSRSRARRG